MHFRSLEVTLWQKMTFFSYVVSLVLYLPIALTWVQDSDPSVDALESLEQIDVSGITLDQTRSVLGHEFAQHFSLERLRQYPLSKLWSR